MLNTETKNQIINRIQKFANAVTNDEDKFILATELVDRLFIADYFSNEDMTNLIKNELTSMFGLKSIQTQKLVKQYIDKAIFMQDKLTIANLKKILEEIPIYEGELLKCLNLNECKNIVNNIKNNQLIKNQKLFEDFTLNYLSEHFHLDENGKKEIKEVLDNG